MSDSGVPGLGSAAGGFVAGFAIAALMGQAAIPLLRRLGARQTVSDDAPVRHAEKQGTPTMGGVLILAGLALPVTMDVALRPDHSSALALLLLALAFGVIGLVDDLLIARRGRNLGLKARQKLALQVLAAAAFVVWLRATAVPGRTTQLLAWPGVTVDLGEAYYALGLLLVVGMSNAVNFADGLDGLAGGVGALMALSLSVSCFAGGALGWLPLFGGALAGASAGFLWHNAHPAQVFMGDTGSLPLGAVLAGMALLGKAEAPFQAFAIYPWAALISVIVQVVVFQCRARRRGREYAKAHRVFRRTPIHHHFEELGWPETRIVQRAWLLTAAACAGALAVFGTR